MVAKKRAPIAYPTTPPKTDPKVQMPAKANDCARRARHIGTSNTSGGIGNIELSAKEIMNSHILAAGLAAFVKVQAYNLRSIRPLTFRQMDQPLLLLLLLLRVRHILLWHSPINDGEKRELPDVLGKDLKYDGR